MAPRHSGDAEAPAVSVPPEHFDGLYADSNDPWRFRTSWYERRKYALTVAALPRERYKSGFEPGCSIGLMTTALASRCDRLVAVDSSQRAVDLTRATLVNEPHVTVERAVLPEGTPDGPLDLIVASEVLYYLSAADLTAFLDMALRRLQPGGHFVTTHHRAADRAYGYDGFNVHDTLRQRNELAVIVEHEEAEFSLTVLERHG